MEGSKQFLGWVLILCITIAPVYAHYYTQSVPYVPRRKQVTKLHFFFHDTLGGKNPSAVMVARANNSNNELVAPFGSVFALDDPLTVGPEPTSGVIGNAQGLYVSSSQSTVPSLVAYFDFGFTSGKFNGSSISVFSRNPIANTERELAVVGGRGKFRMATGFALLKTYFLNETNGDAIVEYNVTGEYYSVTRVPKRQHERKTILRFYLHDILSGPSPSAVKVAGSNLTAGDPSPTPFGSVYAIDDALRAGPEPNSTIIGNAQGLYLSSSKDYNKFTIVMYADFAFTTGRFNGSSISVFSRNPVTEPVREVAVVGGRGRFRMAKGFAKVRTSYFNATNGDAILQYRVVVFH
ncbi:hypothetical protein Tsubulata_010966 [Turnera subulata]|uniref:Dirigent protein n=1 Tax=Turnera subulata TaxID=218843 RepID=A0A9Q0F6Z1_9ROSI|nr:hypothetical protein Tsubulata_010966 [Turnera subulata]